MSNPLEALPAQVRLYVYLVLGVAAVAIGAWQASEGDWLTAISLFLGTLGFGMAGSNTPSTLDGRRKVVRR